VGLREVYERRAERELRVSSGRRNRNSRLGPLLSGGNVSTVVSSGSLVALSYTGSSR